MKWEGLNQMWMSWRSWDGEVYPVLSRWANGITRVLVRERGSRKVRVSDLKMWHGWLWRQREGPWVKGCNCLEKLQGINSPLETPERNAAWLTTWVSRASWLLTWVTKITSLIFSFTMAFCSNSACMELTGHSERHRDKTHNGPHDADVT